MSALDRSGDRRLPRSGNARSLCGLPANAGEPIGGVAAVESQSADSQPSHSAPDHRVKRRTQRGAESRKAVARLGSAGESDAGVGSNPGDQGRRTAALKALSRARFELVATPRDPVRGVPNHPLKVENRGFESRTGHPKIEFKNASSGAGFSLAAATTPTVFSRRPFRHPHQRSHAPRAEGSARRAPSAAVSQLLAASVTAEQLVEELH